MKVLLILSFLFFIIQSQASVDENSVDTSVYVKEFYHEFQKYDLEHVKSERLQSLVELMQSKNLHLQDIPDTKRANKCLMCRSQAFVLIEYFKANFSISHMQNVVLQLCAILKTTNSMGECKSIVDIFSPTAEYILRNKPDISVDRVCSLFVEECGPKFEEKKLLVEIDQTVYKLNVSKPLSRTSEKKPLRVVQISDPHFDPNYIVGGNTDCKELACCHRLQGLPKNSVDAAGYWGDYRSCDTPIHAIEDTFYQIKKEHEEIDYIYFTGDIVDHFVFQTSIESNSKSVKTIFNMLKNTFGDIPVFPIYGNHEAHPVNLYPPTNVPKELSLNWLYELSKEEWKDWIPENDLDTLFKGGYYTTLVRPGLRVIAINSNFAYFENYWLVLDDEYFKEHLQWIHDTLLEAEKNSEKVHILSHVPPNGGMYHKWSYNYNLIVERFAETISAQFTGHTHADEFYLYFASDNKDVALNVAWNGGSATTFIDVNPNYVVYDIDATSYEVLDKTTWIYNLTEANTSKGKPRWFKEYSFKEEFDSDLSPASLNSLVDRFSTDKELLRKYWTFKFKSAEPSLKNDCDKCLIKHLCEIVESDFHTSSYCKKDSEPVTQSTLTPSFEL